ncbi:hypothetical protein Q5P01_014884 [Channa striata]|uniref:Uncharacterized protein n=1 Tax=Channa striata TaxID=64152 RepID=A0AA88MKR5_CHASR|nr:hypothetical protein Q5P01_014884 [Channa striata]
MPEEEKRERLIISVQQSLSAQKHETEKVRASFHQRKFSSSLETAEEKWKRKVSNLEELLTEKDKEINRAVEKRRARTQAHVDTLAELTETQSALKQSRLRCVALEEKLQTLLAKKEERFRKELLETEKSFRQQLSEQERRFTKELSEKNRRKEREELHKDVKSRMELVELCDIWQSKAQQWQKEKMELEEMLRVKEKMWNQQEAKRKEEIQPLTEKKTHLQITVKKKQKKRAKRLSASGAEKT